MIVLAARATPPTPLVDLRPAGAAVLAWAAVSVAGPTLAGDPITPLDGAPAALTLIAAAAVLSLGTLGLLGYRERRREVADRLSLGEPSFERIS